MTMVGRNPDYFILPGRGSHQGKAYGSKWQSSSSSYLSAPWEAAQGAVHLPSLSHPTVFRQHHTIRSGTVGESLLDSVAMNYNRPGHVPAGRPSPGAPYASPPKRGWLDSRESPGVQGSGFRSRGAPKPEAVPKRSFLRPSTQPYNLYAVYSKPKVDTSPPRLWASQDHLGGAASKPRLAPTIHNRKGPGPPSMLPKVPSNARNPLPASRGPCAADSTPSRGGTGVYKLQVPQESSAQFGGAQRLHTAPEAALPVGNSAAAAEPRQPPAGRPQPSQFGDTGHGAQARSRGQPFGRSTLDMGTGKINFPARKVQTRDPNAWGAAGSHTWLSPSRGGPRDRDGSPPNNMGRWHANPLDGLEGSSGQLLFSSGSKKPRASPADAGGPRTRSRPMEASKKAGKQANTRGGRSMVLAMSGPATQQPPGPLPSSTPSTSLYHLQQGRDTRPAPPPPNEPGHPSSSCHHPSQQGGGSEPGPTPPTEPRKPEEVIRQAHAAPAEAEGAARPVPDQGRVREPVGGAAPTSVPEAPMRPDPGGPSGIPGSEAAPMGAESGPRPQSRKSSLPAMEPVIEEPAAEARASPEPDRRQRRAPLEDGPPNQRKAEAWLEVPAAGAASRYSGGGDDAEAIDMEEEMAVDHVPEEPAADVVLEEEPHESSAGGWPRAEDMAVDESVPEEYVEEEHMADIVRDEEFPYEREEAAPAKQQEEGLMGSTAEDDYASDSESAMDETSAFIVPTDETGNNAANARSLSDSDVETGDDNAALQTRTAKSRVLSQRYEVLKIVGEGAYGLVMKCRRRKDNQYVAIKEFKIEDDDPDADDVRRTSQREVQLLKELQHRHVVTFIEDFHVDDRLFIVMEFVPCNLLEVLESHVGGLDREMIRSVIFQARSPDCYMETALVSVSRIPTHEKALGLFQTHTDFRLL